MVVWCTILSSKERSLSLEAFSYEHILPSLFQRPRASSQTCGGTPLCGRNLVQVHSIGNCFDAILISIAVAFYTCGAATKSPRGLASLITTCASHLPYS